MKNRYDLILAAGSRINGMPKFGSEAEALHHKQHVDELYAELGSNIIHYLDNLGFMVVELTDEEYEKYKLDHRVYSLEKTEIITPCKTLFTTRDTGVNNQWHLQQLSNRLFNPIAVLCGWDLSYLYAIWGTPSEYSVVMVSIILKSNNNKLIHNLIPHSYEVELGTQAYNDGAYLDWSYNIVIQQLSTSSNVLEYDIEHYIGYNHALEVMQLKKTTDYPAEFVPLYTVKLKLYDDFTTVYYSGSSQIGFYDLVKLPDNSPVYQATVQGEGVEIIIGDTQLNIFQEDLEGRATIEYNTYADIYINEYGAWDTNNSLIDQHGTACALAAAGKVSGVASKSKITGVTCLDISEDRGNLSSRSLTIPFNWMISYIQGKKYEAAPKAYPIVVSLSLGGGNSPNTAIDSALAAIVATGATVVIAAGNDNIVHNGTPYSSTAILVAASTEGITPCDFTNYGPHVDIYAPGEDIYSVLGGDYARWQGTSAACPNVAGLCALFLSMYPDASPAEVKEALKKVAADIITYNKDATTYLFAQNPCYGFIDRQSLNTAELREELIYTAIPYFIGFDGERVYGAMNELTLNSITSAIVSAGKSESVELATAIKLIP